MVVEFFKSGKIIHTIMHYTNQKTITKLQQLSQNTTLNNYAA